MAHNGQRIEFPTLQAMTAHLDRWAATSLTSPAQWRLPLDPPGGSDHGGQDRNRVAAFCDRCAARLPVRAGRVERVGTREVVRCDPACPPDSAH